VEKYLTDKGVELIKLSVRQPETAFSPQDLWVATWLHKILQELEDIPRLYLSLLIELGYLDPRILQDIDLDEAYRKIKSYGEEVIRDSFMSRLEKNRASLELWDEEDEV